MRRRDGDGVLPLRWRGANAAADVLMRRRRAYDGVARTPSARRGETNLSVLW